VKRKSAKVNILNIVACDSERRKSKSGNQQIPISPDSPPQSSFDSENTVTYQKATPISALPLDARVPHLASTANSPVAQVHIIVV
jgi:hypothetical protein